MRPIVMMSTELWNRVAFDSGAPRLRRTGTGVGEVLDRLEGGEGPREVASGLGLDAADLIAALGASALGPDGSEGPPLIQQQPPRPRLAGALSEASWQAILPEAPRIQVLALTAGLLQVHDFWDASHTDAQQADDLGERSFSAYWHGVAHRREPDPGNASYWFRRVGRHPLFGPLGRATRPTLEAHGDPTLTDRLTPGEVWDPFAMIDLCSRARAGSAEETLARKLQRLEMALLLQATAEAVLPQPAGD